MPDARHLNAALIVKCVHCIQPLAKAPGWHGYFHDEWKLAGDGLAAGAAFVTSGHLVVVPAHLAQSIEQPPERSARRGDGGIRRRNKRHRADDPSYARRPDDKAADTKSNL